MRAGRRGSCVQIIVRRASLRCTRINEIVGADVVVDLSRKLGNGGGEGGVGLDEFL
jgi:hypothetical protein